MKKGTQVGGLAMARKLARRKRYLFELGRAMMYILAPVGFVALVMIPGVPEWALTKVDYRPYAGADRKAGVLPEDIRVRLNNIKRLEDEKNLPKDSRIISD
eukprot:TRINITY_DN10099_c0_g1_i1.p1 TRINITY_DN10099_c0_g1~~TRINITY_DN10099_c0_g1_i1.p1  ORF type:complete len:101 (+),score=18.86 TRINITY_DN10099_c0_g1_i1:202-504(+)